MLSVMIKLKVNTILLLSIFQYYVRFTRVICVQEKKNRKQQLLTRFFVTRTDSKSLRREILLRTTMGVQTFHWSWFSFVEHGFGAGLFPGFGSVPADRRCVVVFLLMLLILVLTEYFISSCLFTGFSFFCLFLFNSVLKLNFRFINCVHAVIPAANGAF